MKTPILLTILTVMMASTLACASRTTSAPTMSPTPPPVEEGSQPECVETPPPSMVESISETFEVPEEKIEAWYCSGESFEDILLALQTSELTDLEPEEALERKDEIGWEQLWAELNLVFTPEP